jgi:hypothetical protein
VLKLGHNFVRQRRGVNPDFRDTVVRGIGLSAQEVENFWCSTHAYWSS